MKKMMFNDRYGLTEAVTEKRKTVTRRIMNPQPSRCDVCKPDNSGRCIDMDCQDYPVPITKKPPYRIGEIVAVAQSYENAGYREDKIFYRSVPEVGGYKKELAISQKGWNNKMFVSSNLMPHQILILDVRAERLQGITEEDCLREGIEEAIKDVPMVFQSPRSAFAWLIDKISGKGTWDHNPYVWRIEFELLKPKS